MKTIPNNKAVEEFLNDVENEQRRKDAFELLDLMKDWFDEPPVMWGPSIVGFGSYHYKYDSGREGDFFVAGFSPRKTALTIYIMSGFETCDELMSKLGKYKTGKSCLYVRQLSDIDTDVLKSLVLESVKWVREKYPD